MPGQLYAVPTGTRVSGYSDIIGETMSLPWLERLHMLSINPDAATPQDIARMATNLSDILRALEIAEITGVPCRVTPLFWDAIERAKREGD